MRRRRVHGARGRGRAVAARSCRRVLGLGARRCGAASHSASSAPSGGRIAETTRLTELRVVAREERAAAVARARARSGRYPTSRRSPSNMPLRERPVILLMQALHATGRQAEACGVPAASASTSPRRPASSRPAELVALERAVAAGADPLDAVHAAGHCAATSSTRSIGGGSVRAGLRGDATGHRAARRDQGDPARRRRRRRVRAPVRGRGAARRPTRTPAHRPALRLLARAGGAYLVFRLLSAGPARTSVSPAGRGRCRG